MRTPGAEHAEVPERKVTDYLLSLKSEGGQGKAVFFMSLGFDPESWQVLANALKGHVRANDYVEARRTRWGVRYVVEGPLQCPDGGLVNVRSIWNIEPPATHPRLVTSYPLPRMRS